jgi:sec-independent protein translocase protein TatA
MGERQSVLLARCVVGRGGRMIPIVGEIIGWEALVVVGLVVLLFGSSQLPKLARSVGQASRELRRGMHEDQDASNSTGQDG